MLVGPLAWIATQAFSERRWPAPSGRPSSCSPARSVPAGRWSNGHGRS